MESKRKALERIKKKYPKGTMVYNHQEKDVGIILEYGESAYLYTVKWLHLKKNNTSPFFIMTHYTAYLEGHVRGKFWIVLYKGEE
jgi:hypothetical protein